MGRPPHSVAQSTRATRPRKVQRAAERTCLDRGGGGLVGVGSEWVVSWVYDDKVTK